MEGHKDLRTAKLLLYTAGYLATLGGDVDFEATAYQRTVVHSSADAEITAADTKLTELNNQELTKEVNQQIIDAQRKKIEVLDKKIAADNRLIKHSIIDAGVFSASGVIVGIGMLLRRRRKPTQS